MEPQYFAADLTGLVNRLYEKIGQQNVENVKAPWAASLKSPGNGAADATGIRIEVLGRLVPLR